jgi:hypothetical protein
MMEYIPCYGAPAEHWGLLPAIRLASREILIEQNIKKQTGQALCVFSLLGDDHARIGSPPLHFGGLGHLSVVARANNGGCAVPFWHSVYLGATMLPTGGQGVGHTVGLFQWEGAKWRGARDILSRAVVGLGRGQGYNRGPDVYFC